jgi:hypothetical protein
MKRRCGFLLVAAVVGLVGFVVLFPGKAHAQDFTVFGGFQHPGGINLLPTAGSIGGAIGQAITDPKDFGVFGARLYRSSAPLGFEHTIAYSPNFIESDASALIYSTNLRVELPAPIFRPYATAGLGLVRASGEGPAAFGSKFSFNYGGGLKASVFGPAGIRLDVRGYSIRGVQDQTLKVFEGTVGIFFSF